MIKFVKYKIYMYNGDLIKIVGRVDNPDGIRPEQIYSDTPSLLDYETITIPDVNYRVYFLKSKDIRYMTIEGLETNEENEE
jgi:hypothetical protein